MWELHCKDETSMVGWVVGWVVSIANKPAPSRYRPRVVVGHDNGLPVMNTPKVLLLSDTTLISPHMNTSEVLLLQARAVTFSYMNKQEVMLVPAWRGLPEVDQDSLPVLEHP